MSVIEYLNKLLPGREDLSIRIKNPRNFREASSNLKGIFEGKIYLNILY